MMELHDSTTGDGTSDLMVTHAEPAEPSCESVKNEQAIRNPSNFSKEEREPSCVSIKSDRFMGNPTNFSKEERDLSCVSMKSDRSMGNPTNFSKEERDLSCVSMKSDRSMGNPTNFSKEEREPSYVSMKSDRSMGNPTNFSKEEQDPSCVSMKSDRSMGNPTNFSKEEREPSYVSMKSDRSMGNPTNFSKEEREPSRVSIKSDRSMGNPTNFSKEERDLSRVSIKSDRSMGNPTNFSKEERELSCVSMKSDRSMGNPTNFSKEEQDPSCVSMKSDRSMGNPTNFSKEEQDPSCVSMKSDRSMGNPTNFSSEAAPSDPKHSSTEAVPYTGPLQQNSYQPVDGILYGVIKRHKTCMKNKYEILFEGIKTEENKTLLKRIFTQLYIIEGESEGVNEEHEVLQMERTIRKHVEDIPINCTDIFKPLQGQKDHKYKERKKKKGQKTADIRIVLTKGIAGIGKTVSVQKFILDWAEEEANQDVDFMFVLPFRELNLIKDDQYSLHGLLCAFHPELKDLDSKIYDKLKAVFIFDGLDESRIPMKFEECEKVSDITMTSSVDVLMTNLIKGELLPSALIWITCRPAAANQILSTYINRVTEIQGFNDPQKEEYFRKRISDQEQAQKIISHIKTARSLHIMCHIPVFCWISATVLQRIIKQHQTEIPKTLTEMYSHFLLTQINMKNEKYEEKDEKDPKKLLESNRTKLLKLADLAFKQLMKGNVMFYEEDLKESGIDITEASTFSGVFTEIFREECGLYQRKVYCFVHLSFQEFLAAVYVFHCYENENLDELLSLIPYYSHHNPDHVPLDYVLKESVDKAVESPNGHLDLFLRFLLGISLESNQILLKGLLTHTHTHSEKTTEHIKSLIKIEHISLSTERSINLFLCMSEMKDQSLFTEIQKYLKSEKHSEKISDGQCTALACMLLTSDKVLEELDMKNYNTSEKGYRRLIPAVIVCRRAVLVGCFLTSAAGEDICSALQSVNSSLKELDLSSNDLQDSGVELITAGLKSSHCKLEKLRLGVCKLEKKSCENLSSVLELENSSLKELDLSYNDLQDLGVELLSTGLKSSHCKLESLSLVMCNLGEKSCEYLGSVLQSVNFLKELDLSNNDLQDSGVELLCAGLKSSNCKLQILRLSGCMITEEGCFSLASALKSNINFLKELDLRYNHPGDSGLKLLYGLREDPQCKLEKLLVEHGGQNRIKPGVKKYACDFNLDPNTIHTLLSLSEGNKYVTWEKEHQPYPDHPDRFNRLQQVLSVESLPGRCYWVAELKGGKQADVAVSYRGIKRKEGNKDGRFGSTDQSWVLKYNKGGKRDSWFGSNDMSWIQKNSKNSYTLVHNNVELCEFPLPRLSNRVGVYLDWPAGILTFYSISYGSHKLTQIHTLQTKFTEPLYAGFVVHYGSSARVCEIE